MAAILISLTIGDVAFVSVCHNQEGVAFVVDCHSEGGMAFVPV